jgi:hypothetical protein
LTFGVPLAGDAEPLEHALDMRRGDAAAGGRAAWPSSTARCSRVGRRHVGLGRALAHGDTDAGTREVSAAGHHLAPLDELVDRRAVATMASVSTNA